MFLCLLIIPIFPSILIICSPSPLHTSSLCLDTPLSVKITTLLNWVSQHTIVLSSNNNWQANYDRICAWSHLYLWYSRIFLSCIWVIRFLMPWLAAGFSVDMVINKYPPFCIMLPVTAPRLVPRPLGWDTLQLAVFAALQIRPGVYWLGGNQLRLPDVGAEEAQHLCLAGDTGILESQGAIPPGFNPLWRS